MKIFCRYLVSGGRFIVLKLRHSRVLATSSYAYSTESRRQTAPDTVYDVVISGGGMVGTAMAAALGQSRVNRKMLPLLAQSEMLPALAFTVAIVMLRLAVVMAFGKLLTPVCLSHSDSKLESVNEEKDLGIIVSDDLKWEKHCSAAVTKSNRIPGMIKQNFTDRSKEVIIPLYKSLARLHLEYCCQIWNPNYNKNIDLVEGVQRQATKLITGMQNLSYDDRVKHLGLVRLNTRRLRSDLVETFKIINGKYSIHYIPRYFSNLMMATEEVIAKSCSKEGVD